MIKRFFAKGIALLMGTALLLTACSSPASTVPSSVSTPAENTGTLRLQDDFYEAINAAWLANTELPSDSPYVGGFSEIDDNITDTMMADFGAMMKGGTPAEDESLKQFFAFYSLTADIERRNTEGVEPLLPYLAQIEKLGSLADLNKDINTLVANGMPLPFNMMVTADMKDANTNALYLMAPSLFLMDKSYYESEMGEQLAALYAQQAQNLLLLTGKTEQEAAEIAMQALEFDALLVPFIKSSEEASDFTKQYNPAPAAAFAEDKNLDFSSLFHDTFGGNLAQVVISDPLYFEAMNEVVNEENFPLLKSWMQVGLLDAASTFLSEEYRETSATFGMAMSGQTELSSIEESAYITASILFSPVVGQYYGETYFGEEAKQDVTDMVHKMVGIYKNRLSQNTWLSDETKTMAIAKLDTMAIQIGYPDNVPALYTEFVVDSEQSLFENAMEMTRMMLQDMYSKCGQPVDRSQWGISADTVNAIYSPMSNTITFPAAILQAPFYSTQQTPSQNYGGIGAVIAHEISHAFDPNGAHFDEFGNLEDWWTEQDYAEFEKRTDAMVAEFDGMEFEGGTVNGLLTVTENTADAGGLSCALEVVQNLDDGNLEEFFTNWAVIWRQKNTPEYTQMLLAMDVHAPNKLRANIQLQNMDDFFTTFEIVEKDGMWRAPEDRVAVW